MLPKFAIWEDDNCNAPQNEDHLCLYQIIFVWKVLVFKVVYGNRVIVCVDLWCSRWIYVCLQLHSVMRNTSLQRNILTWNVIMCIFFLSVFLFYFKVCPLSLKVGLNSSHPCRSINTSVVVYGVYRLLWSLNEYKVQLQFDSCAILNSCGTLKT